MAKLKIEGLPQRDGEYDLDISRFTGSELHTVKEISGVRAGELQEALAAGDYDLVVAMTVIVLRRAGQTVDPAEIMEAEVGAITVDFDDAEVVEEEIPPPSAQPSGNSSSSDGAASENGGTETSGPGSSEPGDQPPSPLKAIGSLG
jgi:hypothetical protein